MYYRYIIGLLCLWAISIPCSAQNEIYLYEGDIPHAKPEANIEETRIYNNELDTLIYNVSTPTLSVFFPNKEKNSGTAIIICPGGAYNSLLIKQEGTDIACQLAKVGVTAFVLKYRLPDDRLMTNKAFVPLMDLQKAISLVRLKSKEWEIDPDKVGVMGFSAGGHLAASAGTHSDTTLIAPYQEVSVRPDFMILVNPVISFSNEIGHQYSKTKLLGEDASPKKVRYFSNELQISENTPPAFLIHAAPDDAVLVDNSWRYFYESHRRGVSCEMHIYAKGEHGFLTNPKFDEWFGRCLYWLRTSNWL